MAQGFSYAALVHHWPKGRPILCLGGEGWRRPLIATAWVEVPFQALMAAPFGEPWHGREDWSLGHGTRNGDDLEPWAGIGLVSYDQFRPGCTQPAPSRFFAIYEAIVWDPAGGDWRIKGGRPKGQPWSGLSSEEVDHVLAQMAGKDSSEEGAAPSTEEISIDLSPLASSDDYLKKAQKVLEDIRAGRYYQLNLLRYFRLPKVLAPQDLATRLDRHGGPMSAWISFPELSLISFSPERFFSGERDPRDGSWVLQAWPIKGTAHRAPESPERDLLLREELGRSAKDRAELAIIIDLLRNDLARISRPHSVSVLDPGSVHSFSHVHHLVARIESRLDPSLKTQDVLASLCPAGSITGAPKREVMDAIKTYEERERRYFMGHILQWCLGDGFDSSILIRTAVAEGDWEQMEYAAGSGLVIHSDPKAELREIEAKAAVLGPLGRDL